MKCFTDSEMRNNYSKYLYDTEQSFVPGIDETKPEKVYETKRNFTLDETKRNEISLFFCFAKQAKFRETSFLFRIVSCFAKQKKGSEMETLLT
jgi:hypothetical protein